MNFECSCNLKRRQRELEYLQADKSYELFHHIDVEAYLDPQSIAPVKKTPEEQMQWFFRCFPKNK